MCRDEQLFAVRSNWTRVWPTTTNDRAVWNAWIEQRRLECCRACSRPSSQGYLFGAVPSPASPSARSYMSCGRTGITRDHSLGPQGGSHHGESLASEATHTTQLARVRLAGDEERSTNYMATITATRPGTKVHGPMSGTPTSLLGAVWRKRGAHCDDL